MKVPFLDLKAHHRPLRDEFLQAIAEVVDSGAFAGGRFVEEFEKDFAKYCGTESAIGVGSGTEALLLALKALDVGPGDEVITVPSTFIATAEAISHAGANPVFVDVCENTCNMDPDRLEGAVSAKTKAIIPVHLFGQPADMAPILEFARRKGLPVIEDAAQAHGATYRGQKAGSMGDLGCFSFYPGKNLGAFGEGGAVVTNNKEFDERIRMLRDHGQSKKYHHKMVGWNSRMDGIQGAVLRIKLRHLERNIDLRNSRARRYIQRLKDLDKVVLPKGMPDVRHVWHLFAVRVEQRDEIMRLLGEHGVACGIHYPIPVHLQGAYRSLGYKRGDFPIAERCAEEFVSLPMYPELGDEQIDHVADSLRKVMTDIRQSTDSACI